MAILGQYNQTKNLNNSNNFLNPVKTKMKTVRMPSTLDFGVTSSGGDASKTISFLDEALSFEEDGKKFTLNKSYYFHGRIRRLSKEQTITIKLINKSNHNALNNSEQYLKTIVVQPGKFTPTEIEDEKGNTKSFNFAAWADIEFIFTPLDGVFDTILFELNRSEYDLATVVIQDKQGNIKQVESQMRYPVIIYEELSEIQNFLTKESLPSLLKIGVQSRPGLMMCINHEEIRTGRTGIYELRNGAVTIDFFSVVCPSVDQTIDVLELEKELDMAYVDIYNNQHLTGSAQLSDEQVQISRCIIDNTKKTIIDPFTLDYMYA